MSLDGRAQHRVDVELTASAGAGGALELWMPAWTPGAYELRTWGRNVTPLDARDGGGRALGVVRTGPSTFRVDAGGAATVRLRYRVYAPRLLDDGSHADGEHALLNGSSIFLAVRGQERTPHRVRIALPPGWRAATALDGDAGGWRAPDYEALIDAPIECGRFAEATVRAAGRRYHIVVDDGEPAAGARGAGAEARRPSPVPARFVDDVGRIAAAEARVAGAPPYRRYTLIVHLADEPGRVAALEHAASASILVPRRSFTDTGDYDELRYVVAHELFHAWNARRLRPAELVPYDLLHEQTSRALWITEGLTEYYAHRAMLSSGCWSRAEYLAHVAEEAERAVTAARDGRSLEEAAALSWQTPDEDGADHDAYYARGHLVALGLDAAVRAASAGARSLDDVVRALLAEAARRGGVLPVDTATLARALDGVAPGVGALAVAWARDGHETTALPAVLARVGLRLAVDVAPPRAEAGFAADREGAALRVRAVVPAGAADLAGLRPGDLVVALDGAAPGPRWADAVGRKPPGARLVLTVRRGDRALALHLTLGSGADVACTLDADAPAAPAPARLRDAFLSP